MSNQNQQKTLPDLLQKLRVLAPLKELFWSVLNYERENQILNKRGWPDAAGRALVGYALITFLVHPSKAYLLKAMID